VSQSLVVIGGGGHARVVLSILQTLPDFTLAGYTDLEDRGALFGVRYLGPDTVLATLHHTGNLAAAMGVGQVGLGDARRALWERLEPFGFAWPAIISPHAVVDAEALVSEAAVVMPGTVVNCGAVLGRGAILNTGSVVEHDSRIGDWAHVAPGATICGGVNVGEGAMIGAGAVVIEGRSIAPGSIVGAGATVVRDIVTPGVYAGTPAQRIRQLAHQ
jgi:sugar O-acyltransferase (sialic acid O-acetyltransferase NeuD family)